MYDGPRLLEALGALPGGPELLAASAPREDVALVGGAVRDLLLGRTPRELDVVIAGDSEPLARELASALNGQLSMHERFGTAAVAWQGGRIDLARRRGESYPSPGALPVVHPGGPEEDLARRDFTVNAIALALGGERRGRLQHAPHALDDLDAGVLRVLHEHSFLDDPTRLLRLARYSARLGFPAEPHTAELAAQALAEGALATVTPARLGAELRLTLGESDPIAVLEAFAALGVLAGLQPPLEFDAELARRALGLLGAAGEEQGAARIALATLVMGRAATGELGREQAHELLDRLEIPAAERDRALSDAAGVPSLAVELAGAQTPSQLLSAAHASSLEGVALAGAWGERTPALAAAAPAASRWLGGLHAVRLRIDGSDLLAAGVPEGPEVGLRLRAALERKLDGALDGDGSAAELAAALGAPL